MKNTYDCAKEAKSILDDVYERIDKYRALVDQVRQLYLNTNKPEYREAADSIERIIADFTLPIEVRKNNVH